MDHKTQLIEHIKRATLQQIAETFPEAYSPGDVTDLVADILKLGNITTLDQIIEFYYVELGHHPVEVLDMLIQALEEVI